MLRYVVKHKNENKTIYSFLREKRNYPNQLSRNYNNEFIIISECNGFYYIQKTGFKREVLFITDNKSEIEPFIEQYIEELNIYNGEEDRVVNTDNILELTSPIETIYSLYFGINSKEISFNEIKEFQKLVPDLNNKINSKINDFNDFFLLPFIEEYKKRKPNASNKHLLLEQMLFLKKDHVYLFNLYNKIDLLNGSLFDDPDLILHLNTYFVKDLIKTRKQDNYLYSGNKNQSSFYTKFQ